MTRSRTTLERALQELQSHERGLREMPATTRAIHVKPEGLVLKDGTCLELVPDGVRRFCEYAGAPARYVERLGHDVRARLLEHEIERGNLGEAVTVVARGTELVGFADPALLTLRGSEVFNAAVNALPADAGAYVEMLHVADDTMEIDILGDGTSEEMSPGDLVAGGVRLTHSPLGLKATYIQSYLLRLACSNGLMHRDCLKTTRTRRLPADHDGGRELQLDQVRRIVDETWRSLRAKLALLRETQHKQLAVKEALRSWLRRAGLSERQHLDRLLRAWHLDGGQNTMYALVNALTRVASHDPDVTAHQRRVLSGLAGILAFHPAHFCPRCLSVLRESDPQPGGGA